MIIKFKRNFLLMSAFFIFGYAGNLHAGDCGILRFLENKSNGVTIKDNACKKSDEIALGSKLNLMPGARLWFKSQADTSTKTTQGICQNRSKNSIRISRIVI